MENRSFSAEVKWSNCLREKFVYVFHNISSIYSVEILKHYFQIIAFANTFLTESLSSAQYRCFRRY
jgi:hypothetical protein